MASIRRVTDYTLRKGAPDKTRTDAVVVGVAATDEGPVAARGGEAVAAAYGRKFGTLLTTLGVTGKAGEITKVPGAGTLKAPLLVLVGLGPEDRLSPAVVRRAAGVAARAVGGLDSVALALPADDPEHVRAVVEGFELGGYRFDRYRTTGTDRTPPTEVTVLTDRARRKDAATALHLAQVVSEAVRRARDWVNTPAGDLTPPAFADQVVEAARGHKPPRRTGKVSVEVLDERQLAEGGFGGIIGVGQGSASPPRLVRLTYRPASRRGGIPHLALVGKGITYDSGGLTIKPNASMKTMKSDMGGAAAVVSATLAIADLGLPVEVTTLVPMAENMLSGTATRPGDVLEMYGGKTVEVLNTDAEGRLVLADALTLAAESQPDVLVDVATLTGACEKALGERVGGLLGNDDDLVERAKAAGARVGEAFWQLPISEEMPVKVRTYSKVADLMQHNVDLYGGALYAAAFLQEFVPEGTPWAHFDIAGPAFNERRPYGHVTSGGTGISVATLVELATELSARHHAMA